MQLLVSASCDKQVRSDAPTVDPAMLIESQGDALGRDRFAALCGEMQALIDLLDPAIRERYVPGSAVARRAGT